MSKFTLHLGSPTDLIAAVPVVLGFHPDHSLVVLGLTSAKIECALRCDLPSPPHVLTYFAQSEGFDFLFVVGYGPDSLVTPAVDGLRAQTGLPPVKLALRVDEGRFWSYHHDGGYESKVGAPYDLNSARVTAEAAWHGLAPLPNRAALVRALDPYTGAPRQAMRTATADVAVDLMRRLSGRILDPDGFAVEYVAEAMARVRSALTIPETRRRLTDREVAQLGFDLSIVGVRDEAWISTDSTHIPLWQDLTRRLERRFVPPVASLLAFTAWKSASVVLASIALDRALTVDPYYSMAHLIRRAMEARVSPPDWRSLDPQQPMDVSISWLLPLIDLLRPSEPV